MLEMDKTSRGDLQMVGVVSIILNSLYYIKCLEMTGVVNWRYINQAGLRNATF